MLRPDRQMASIGIFLPSPSGLDHIFETCPAFNGRCPSVSRKVAFQAIRRLCDRLVRWNGEHFGAPSENGLRHLRRVNGRGIDFGGFPLAGRCAGLYAVAMRNGRIFVAILITGMALAAGEGSALADIGVDEGADIVVTAQRRAEREEDVPISLVVLDSADLLQRGVADIAKLADEVPGFGVVTTFRGLPVFTLRGVGFNSPNFSAASPVGIAHDDLVMPYPAMAEGPLFDLERIEVLKGPQGTLFGRNTTGGLVRMISVQPSRQMDGYLTISGGSFESYGSQGALGGPLGGNLSARLAFIVERADKGWQISRTRGDRLGRKDRTGARFALRWQPEGGADVTLSAAWWRDRSETQAPQSVELAPQGLISLGFPREDWPLAAAALGLPDGYTRQAFTPTSAVQADWTTGQLPWGGPATPPAPLEFRKNNDFVSAALRASFPLADGVTLHSLSSFAQMRRNEVTDNAGWAFENAITRSRGKISSLAQELRLTGEGKHLDWTLGAMLTRDRVRDRDEAWAGTNSLLQVFRVAAAQSAAVAGADSATQEAALFGFRDYANDTDQTTRSLGLFGQARVALARHVGLTMGLRYTQDHIRFSGCSRDMGDGSLAGATNAFHNFGGSGLMSAVVPGGCTTFLPDLSQGVVRGLLAQDNVSGRMALDWRFATGGMAYVAVARGFKSGTFPNMEGNFAVQYEPARQEQLVMLEAGVKVRPAPWLELDGAVFRSGYRDKQVYGAIVDPVFGTLGRILNVPRSHVFGVEVSLAAKAASRLSLTANLALLDTRIDQYVGVDDFGNAYDFAGARFVFTPRLQMNLAAEQGFALPRRWEGFARMALHHSGPAQSDLASDPRYRVPASDIVDAALTLRAPDGRHQIQLLVRNLTNAYVWNAVYLQSDSFARYAAPPRTWTASLTRTF